LDKRTSSLLRALKEQIKIGRDDCGRTSSIRKAHKRPMNGRWLVTYGPQSLSYGASNSAVAARLIIYAPLEHTKDNIVVTEDEPFDLCSLRIIQRGDIGLPFVARIEWQACEDRMNAGIESLVNVNDKSAKVRQSCRP
jgi:hypothetical protein